MGEGVSKTNFIFLLWKFLLSANNELRNKKGDGNQDG
jgi:hypothetical protein